MKQQASRRNLTEWRGPGPGPGGYGTASEFGSLDGWTLAEADTYLTNHPDLLQRKITSGAYYWYVFKDKSEIHIRPNGEIIRLPLRTYQLDGRRIKGYRINIYTGQIIRTQKWHELPRSEQEWVVR
ncbi:MAG: hypothetical protein HZC41_09900 [Chloroflexi bacterium]|nr:hypothetical protein [Chloroflexota bacterium]